MRDLNPYVLEMNIRQKRRDIAACDRSPKKTRPSIYHRIRGWFTKSPPDGSKMKSPPPEIVPYRSPDSNLVFLQLYRGQRRTGCSTGKHRAALPFPRN